MKISKNGKILLGILTLAQLFIVLFGVIWFFTTLFPVLISGNEEAIQNVIMLSVAKFIIIVIGMSILSLGLQIFYIIHAGTNKSISTVMKIIWICLIFFVGFVVEVVYFFMEIVPENSLTERIERNDQPYTRYGAS